MDFFFKFSKGAQEFGFMEVWSVGRIMSDWLDLSGHQHPNCYLDPGQMTGGGWHSPETTKLWKLIFMKGTEKTYHMR